MVYMHSNRRARFMELGINIVWAAGDEEWNGLLRRMLLPCYGGGCQHSYMALKRCPHDWNRAGIILDWREWVQLSH